MRNPNRVIDKTHLSIDAAEERGLIHRDYIAHCLRWSHVIKRLHKDSRYMSAVVLDVGCGKELPLAKAMYVNKMTPRHYIGVDVNALHIPVMLADKKIPITLYEKTDVCDLTLSGKEYMDNQGVFLFTKPNFIVCFEVLEHVTPAHAKNMLLKFKELLAPGGEIFLSTPCFNGSAAGNHINEMTYHALGALIEDCGFNILSVNGTFASIMDYREKLFSIGPGARYVFDNLREYYDTNFLSIIFAPLFPDSARNCLWNLTVEDELTPRMFPPLQYVPEPWSSHVNYKELEVQKNDAQ